MFLTKPTSMEREFAFTRADFERVRKLIYAYAGIHLIFNKQDMVYNRLSRRLRARQLTNFDEYLSLVEQKNSDEWEFFVSALTTNLTAFFREHHHFEILTQHVRALPQRPIQIWCNAASTGEEVYSIAMTLLDAFDGAPPPLQIIASDVDTQALKKAEAGVYSLESAGKIPANQLKKYFLRGTGAQSGLIRVRDELKAMVQFKQINLQSEAWALRGPFDAIFCRNVMIYFDKNTQRKVLERFPPLLQANGLLFMGHSESLQMFSDLFVLREKTVYTLAPNHVRAAQ